MAAPSPKAQSSCWSAATRRKARTFSNSRSGKNHDPNEVYQKGLTFLQSTHYQRANRFSDELTALFLSESRLAALLAELGACRLEFRQFGQSYRLPSAVREMAPEEPAYRNTLWHNRLFNTQLSDDVRILGFKPDWTAALSLLVRAD